MSFFKALFSIREPKPTPGWKIEKRTYADGSIMYWVFNEGAFVPQPAECFNTLAQARRYLDSNTLTRSEVVG